ncbi:MAG: S1C family serine protease [Thermoleophilaceae bacterium]
MRWVVASIAALALLVAGCGGGGGGDHGAAGARTVETTKVQVVQGVGRKGGFNAESIYRRLSPGVVTIISLFDGRSLLGGDRGGQGSGFVLDGGGYIATNAHVVSGEGANAKPAKQVYVEFTDGNRVAAHIVGYDPNADVALIKVDPGGLSLTPLALGSSSRLVVGEPVAAIGSPFGEQQSLSLGVVSALDRNIDSLTKFGIGNAIQTDAAINPGNSGGPLLDARGRVIGINAQVKSQSGGGEGVGFAVPVDTVRRSLRELRRNGRVDYGFLGVTSQTLYPQLARRLGLGATEGALIVKVEKDSPADHAGLEAGGDKIDFQGQQGIPSGGDVIVGVNGHRLSHHQDLADVISSKRAGQKVRLEVLKGHDRRQVDVTLGRRPAGSAQP